MEEIVKAFNHIVRDILIYVLPGVVLLFYICFVYININSISDWSFLITNNGLIIILIITAYILGHIILAFMELFFVKIPIDIFIKRICFKKEFNELNEESNKFKDGELEILAFSNKNAYDFFVERHTQLSLFRWNLSGSFFIISISTFLLRFIYDWFFISIGFISIFLFLILFLFSIRTEIDGLQRRMFLAKKNNQI